jgi:pyroglutamyl-peptidase
VSLVADRDGLTKHRLPVDFAALAVLVPDLARAATGGLLLVGEAESITELHVEVVALNVLAARIADNRGQQPARGPIVAEATAPLARAGTFDVDAAVAALHAASLPARLSHHAGTFACNQAYYLALHTAAALASTPPIGFVHVPVNEPPSSRDLARGIEEVLLTFQRGRGT